MKHSFVVIFCMDGVACFWKSMYVGVAVSRRVEAPRESGVLVLQ